MALGAWLWDGWRLASAEPFAGIPGDTGLQLAAQAGVVEALADQYQLVLGGRGPVAVVDREALAGEVKDVAPLALVEPEDSLGAEHPWGHLVVEKVLELAQGEGPVTLKGEGGEPFDGLVVGLGAVIMPVIVVMAMAVRPMSVLRMPVLVAVIPVAVISVPMFRAGIGVGVSG